MPAVTSGSQIGVQWTAPVQDVGSLITKYILWYKTQAQGDFVESVELNASTFTYTLTDSITSGVYYDISI